MGVLGLTKGIALINFDLHCAAGDHIEKVIGGFL
jgi:hypothetical protein